MNTPRRLLQALNVRKDEWWLVQKLFLLQFFQGAGITFFFTSAFSRFLEHYPVTELAYAFILSALLLWIAGFVYSKLEHRLSMQQLTLTITAFLAVSMLLFRLGEEFIDGAWFYMLMLAWFNVLYLLNNLMFWGMAAQLYDVRQSKRLFSVISAGDIPAKFIGYSVALVIVTYVGTANLLLAGFLFIAGSYPFLQKILRSEKKGTVHHYDPHSHVSELDSIIKSFTVNSLVRQVALLSLVISVSVVLINYGFYAEVKEGNKDDVALAKFIAFFLATARLLAVIFKILVTSRLLSWLGNRTALIITPVLLVILFVTLELTGVIAADKKVVLYIFGLSAIISEVMNSAINSPVLLTMMQPLSTPERLRAHNIVKGIMDPFAYFISGIFLLILVKLDQYNLHVMSFVLTGLAIAWVLAILSVHRQYLATLIKTISSRYFSQDEFSLLDASARGMIENKIKEGSELEVMYILKMLGSRHSDESKKLISLALNHSSALVVQEVLQLIREQHMKDAESELLEIIHHHPVDKIRSEAVKTLSSIAYQDGVIVPLMLSDNPVLHRSAVLAVLNHSQEPLHIAKAESYIQKLFATGQSKDKIEAASMLCETSHGSFDVELIKLLSESDPELVLITIKAMGHHAGSECLEHLINKADEYSGPVTEALVVAGEKALPFIKKKITSDKCSTRLRESLLNATGRIGGRGGNELLLQLMQLMPEQQHVIIKILHRHHFKAHHDELLLIESLIREYLVSAAGILHMQKRISPGNQNYKVLFGSLQLELDITREALLNLFSFIYDRGKISKIKTAIELYKKETNANAIELVEMTVKKEFASSFNAAFEQGDLDHRCELLKTIFPRDSFPGIDAILQEVLQDKRLIFNNWTKACSLYTTKKTGPSVEKTLVDKYLGAENLLLRETAAFAAGNS